MSRLSVDRLFADPPLTGTLPQQPALPTHATTGAPTSAEKAERERRRQFAHGITRFAFSPDGASLLLPVDGAAVLFDTRSERFRTVTPPATRQTDLRFSPRGRYLSYVRGSDLYLYDLEAERETPISRDGSGIGSLAAHEPLVVAPHGSNSSIPSSVWNSFISASWWSWQP